MSEFDFLVVLERHSAHRPPTTLLPPPALPLDQQRGAAVIAARGASSAASAANACINHVQSWYGGASEDAWVSMGVPSIGAYGSPTGVIFRYPVTVENGVYQIVPALPQTDFDRAHVAASGQELLEEREAVSDWLP